MESRTPSLRALLAVACLLIATGIGRGIYHHAVVDRRTYVPPIIDDRYRELYAALPPERDLRYVTDAPLSAQHLQAIYALAPHLLTDGSVPARHGVADLMDARRMEELCTRAGMRPVRMFHGGDVALLEALP